MIRIIFFGQDQYSLLVLKEIFHCPEIEILSVVTLPDKPSGREKKIEVNPVKLFSQEQKIRQIDYPDLVFAIRSMRAEKQKPEAGVLASFGAIIPKKIIELFPKGILVVHPSLLPKYRGSSPVQSAILAGEKETGVTIFEMDKKVDHGPIVSQFKEKINPEDNAKILYERLFIAAGRVLAAILPAYVKGKIEARAQDENQATDTSHLTKEDGKIDWKQPKVQIERQIRAMTPWPGAWTEITVKSSKSKVKSQKRLRILKVHLEGEKLVLDEVQLEGKKPVSWEQFKEGHPEMVIGE